MPMVTFWSVLARHISVMSKNSSNRLTSVASNCSSVRTLTEASLFQASSMVPVAMCRISPLSCTLAP